MQHALSGGEDKEPEREPEHRAARVGRRGPERVDERASGGDRRRVEGDGEAHARDVARLVRSERRRERAAARHARRPRLHVSLVVDLVLLRVRLEQTRRVRLLRGEGRGVPT